jgi:preprotein translocase subunit SecG
MLYGLVIAIHVIASLTLIAVILLQAGRGGGLSESFGGSSTQTLFGTKTSLFLRRATEVAAVVYILTCLTLAVMTSHRGRSLVAKGGLMSAPMAKGQGVPMPLANEPMMDF